LVYIALEFVPSIEPPANMRYGLDFPQAKLRKAGGWMACDTSADYNTRDADAGWGAEQV